MSIPSSLQNRLGPGGLDPLEVLPTLPEKIQEAFKAQNTPLLKQAFAELPPDVRTHSQWASRSHRAASAVPLQARD